jgi:hypothetical protein
MGVNTRHWPDANTAATLTQHTQHQPYGGTMDKTDAVLIPREVVERAVWKARIEFSRATGRGRTPSNPNECWTEFNQLAAYLRWRESTGD